MAQALSKNQPVAEFRPHLFGKFFLLQRLAIGGMAEIYRAKVIGAGGFEKELVVKRILPSRSQDEGFIKMLVNEAKLTVQLTHSNIAQIYECGAIDGQYFIAMELVSGVSLKDMMSAFPRAGASFAPEQAIFLVLQLLQGLAYAHRKTDAQGEPLQIVHCDVSPDNCLISFEGEVKLLDFGIARAATGLSNYKEGMLMGKLGYVAPEQASLERAWDHRVDLYAAGILLYELLTKQKPFPKATDVESLVQSRKTKVVAPTAIDEKLPKEIDAILLKALAYDPGRRYPDARAFADALVDVLFPTPHSALQDLLGKQMHQVYADRISKQRTARAHDALVTKVLQHAAEQKGASEQPGVGQSQIAPSHEVALSFDTPRQTVRAASRVEARTVRIGVPARRAVLIGLVVAVLGTAGMLAAATYLQDGLLVVNSQPTGAQVELDGKAVPGVTPVIIDGVNLTRPHSLQLTAPDHKPLSIEVPVRLGRLVRRINGELISALGSLRLESDPPGASVQFDGRLVGSTPLTLTDVRMDVRHRFDLSLPGHEIDQFVVLPEKDGARFLRRLSAPGGHRRESRFPSGPE